ncbi:MAG: sensor histidine kinase, partial [Cytophagaceae bacterium]
DAVWDWNISDNILWWSEGFTNRFGHSNQGREKGIERWYEKIHQEDRKNVVESMNRLLEGTEKEWSREYRLNCSDGSIAHILTRGYLIRNEKGVPQRMLASLIDLTELKEAQADLERTNANLIRINADLDSFIYTASHDLKAPVANIEGLISTLDSELSAKTEEVQFIVDLIKDSVEKFKMTIRDLSEITKIQKEDHEDLAIINIREIVEDVKISIRNIIISSDTSIFLDCDDCPEIRFSKKNLKSIIYNLLSNAVKYRFPGRKPEVHIKTEVVNKYVLLTVRDNGLGIDPEKKDRIFKMFKRLHDHVEGSGVGLYIVKKIVENSGGMIEVESELGEGTEFKVYFKSPN